MDNVFNVDVAHSRVTVSKSFLNNATSVGLLLIPFFLEHKNVLSIVFSYYLLILNCFQRLKPKIKL